MIDPYKQLYFTDEQIIAEQEKLIKLLKARIKELEKNYYER